MITRAATTVGAGGASVLSRALGAGDLARAARATGTSLASYWILSALLGVLGIVFLDPLVTVARRHGRGRAGREGVRADPARRQHHRTGFSSLVRAEGRMGYSTLEWIIPVVTQIVLDPVFIIGFHSACAARLGNGRRSARECRHGLLVLSCCSGAVCTGSVRAISSPTSAC